MFMGILHVIFFSERFYFCPSSLRVQYITNVLFIYNLFMCKITYSLDTGDHPTDIYVPYMCFLLQAGQYVIKTRELLAKYRQIYTPLYQAKIRY